ncbi:hypothetical protein IJJ49_00785 [Candidatus Saccharibacteria bacterium]|nr:hypothetical protein [Candidatus Saccharibacteria bacterium]
MDKEKLRHIWLAVITGGKGTRLFPISHEGCPKQFCDINNRSEKFIQVTIKRFLKLGISPTQVVVITTNPDQTRLAKEQVRGLGVLSQNIYEVEESWGYPGVMVKSTEIIAAHDREAIIINTPSDQYIVDGDEFKKSVEEAINVAEQGSLAVVGVRITDLVTATGCGHVVYESEEVDQFGFRKMKDFIEKPAEDIADQLMRNSGSACNTGINVWRATRLLETITPDAILIRRIESNDRGFKWELKTDEFLKMMPEVRAISGEFSWYDCGTLQALYEISPKTPNHKNASIGGGEIYRTDCLENLFYAPEGFRLHATGFRGVCGAVNTVKINGVWRSISCITRMSDSQRVKELAENILASKYVLGADFQLNARNNTVMRSNVSDEMIFGFVGVENCIISAYKNPDGIFDVYMSQQAAPDLATC